MTELSAQENTTNYKKNWPQWRGPDATGYASIGNPPIEWSETKNVKWKIEIPGRGHSSPYIYGIKLVFVLTAVKTDLQGIEKDETAETRIY